MSKLTNFYFFGEKTRRKDVFFTFYLRMSKKSSTFAGFFE